MGFLDELKKLTRPYDEDEFEDEGEEEIVEEPARPAAPAEKSGRPNPFAQSGYSAPASAPAASGQRGGKVVSLGGQQSQVVVVNPTDFGAAASLADHLREKRTVVLNLENASKDIARRLIDFLSGAAYALDGKIRRVAGGTYIVTPSNVDLMGEQSEEQSDGGMSF